MNPVTIRSSRAKWFTIPVSLIVLIIPSYSAIAANQRSSSRSIQYLTPLKFDSANNFVGGYAAVKIGKKWGSINTSGKVVVPIVYDKVYNSAGGLAVAQVGKKFGYINASGEIIIPITFDDVSDLINGFAVVYAGGKYGYIK